VPRELAAQIAPKIAGGEPYQALSMLEWIKKPEMTRQGLRIFIAPERIAPVRKVKRPGQPRKHPKVG
jgi:hypothetical protein